ncbi:SDR family oxidoreductase [Limibacillus sp. MBR-115]|jgi:2,3-dihydro-2,3-dihydroxybenzoate dehydrogenase|uniref:SDR family NAD(P)-dependent oxidoreductase n=1 Tax=Limibacillus sp. MBR-115 TaxID=3156465 RepID=UPI003395CFE8
MSKILENNNLINKTALIVGAASLGGIGFAIANAMAATGATVAIADISEQEARESLKALPQAQGSAHSAHGVDVTVAESVKGLVNEVAATHGSIDILVNAAAILIVEPFLEIDPVSWDQTMAVNLRGQFLVAQEVAKLMVAQGAGGRIILVASNVGRTPRINNASYAASKAAVIHLARSMALEISKHQITTNALCPGSTATTMLLDNQAGGNADRLQGIIHGSLEQWRTGIPLGRLAEPEDQAALCVFLASDGGRHITGQAICIDGGQSLF